METLNSFNKDVKLLIEKRLSEEIISLRERYIKELNLKGYPDINSGWCAAFAEEVFGRVGMEESKDFTIVCMENFMCGKDGDGEANEIWDASLLSGLWGVKPPDGFIWEEVNEIYPEYHVWVVCNGKHFDSESPYGVKSPFDLGIYRRTYVKKS